jgi:hypothetical protein
MTSCGGGGGGGSSGVPVENPTDPPPPPPSPGQFPAIERPLLLDVEEVVPAGDAVAVVGAAVRFGVELGPEHNPDAVRYTWYLDGKALGGRSPELRLDTRGESPGTHVVFVLIEEEGRDASLSWKLQLTAGPGPNRPPSILQAFPPGGRVVPKGERAEFVVVASDVDVGDDLQFSWTLDGKQLSEASPALRVATSGLAPGEHEVTVVVSDGASRPAGEAPAYTWFLDVAGGDQHDLPFISGAWPYGSLRIDPRGMVRFEVRAEVPDAEDRPRFRWEVDGILQPSQESAFHFMPSSPGEGLTGNVHQVTCSLVHGSEEAGEAGSTVGWIVRIGHEDAVLEAPGRNRAPRIAVLSPRSSPSVTLGESMAFRAEAVDPDGDVLTYQWSVDGMLQPSEGPVFTFTPSPSMGGHRPRIEVRVSDGAAASGGGTAWQLLGRWDVKLAPVGSVAFALSSQAVIVDNGQSGTSFTGSWTNSSAGGAYGSSSLYSSAQGHTYTYTIPVSSGRYEVYLWWTTWPSRSTAVKVAITHKSGTANVTVNQQANGGRWNLLGTYDFSTSGKVVITASGDGTSTSADAACLNPVASTSTSSGSAPPGTEFIIDDGGAGTSSVGAWGPSSAPNPYGGRSIYARDSGSYTFQRALQSSGSYSVYAWWTEWASRDDVVPYEIVHSGGTATVRKDQRTNGGKWNLLGTYSFGSSVKVTVRVVDSNTVCADAIRFTPAGSAPPPDPEDPPPPSGSDIILDDGSSGTSYSGFWQPSSGPNPYNGDSLYASGSGSYTYDVRVPAAGTYGVYVWYTEWPSRESAVPYEVRHDSGTAVIKLDQRTGGGRWRPLGDFGFGTTARITVRVVDSSTVCADAVRLVPGGGTGVSGEDPDLPPLAPIGSAAISDLAAFPLTPTLARVSWTTNFPGNSIAYYGVTSSAGDGSRTVTGVRWSHSVVIDNLKENTLYYIKVKSSNSVATKTSSTVSFRTPDATPSYTITSSHPRLFMTPSDVTAIRSRIRNSPVSTWWSKLVSFANQQLTKSVSELINEYPTYNSSLAFAGLIGDNSQWRDHAIAVALKIASLSTSVSSGAMRDRIDVLAPIYDWLYAYLTSAQKTAIRTKLAYYAQALEGRVNEKEYAQGGSNGDQSGAVLAAIAIHGEDSSAAGIISRALAHYNNGFWPFWREHGSENGGSFKSQWYTTVATQFNYEVFAAWKSATGLNLFDQEKAWFQGLSDWYLYAKRGDSSWVRHGDIVYQQGWDEIERYILIHIAREYKNGEAQWLANKIRDYLPLHGPQLVPDILWYDPSVAPKSPSKALNKNFKGTGMAYFQQSWQDGAARASFRCVPFFTAAHTHLDQCSFTIFYKDGLALDSGVYDDFASKHHESYYTRTIAHNTILVDDPSEVFVQYGETRIADGGQYYLDPSRVPHAFPWEVTDLTNSDAFRIGDIGAFEDAASYTYALGDGTRAYNPKKLSAFFRHFLWLKSLSGWSQPVILVFDEVEATKSSFKKTYLLHTQNKPTVSGTLVSAAAGSGLLYQRTVFPQSAAITLVGGAGKEYLVKGVNYPPNRAPKPGEEGGAWRVEVSPSTARTHDEFLHVLYPADSGAAAPPSVRAVDAASMKGCETQGLVVLFAVKLRSVTTATYTVGGARRNLLFGLAPGETYDVYLKGSRVHTLRASIHGSLDFNTSASGEVEVVRK